ncbi:MAG: hypothetical protein F4Y14_09880 [Acidobacteria bacterium]|nr:hypothetical protein [Acidobacteriota bacterium]
MAIRDQVTAVAPYAMLTRSGVHGTITCAKGRLDTGVEVDGFRIECGVCGAVWHEALDYELALLSLEDHLEAEHGDYGTELVVAFR